MTIFRAGLASLAALAVAASPAAARPPDRFMFSFDDSHPVDACAFPVSETNHVTVADHVFYGSAGNVTRDAAHTTLTNVFRNDATGTTIYDRDHYVDTIGRDGRETVVGLTFSLRPSPRGPVIHHTAGRVVIDPDGTITFSSAHADFNDAGPLCAALA